MATTKKDRKYTVVAETYKDSSYNGNNVTFTQPAFSKEDCRRICNYDSRIKRIISIDLTPSEEES